MDDDISNSLSGVPGGVRIRLKVVPGASRTRMVGVLGDRLKVAVAAPPEDGKANRAVCELLGEALGVGLRQVNIIEGQSQPRKTAEAEGVSLCAAVERLGGAMGAGRK